MTRSLPTTLAIALALTGCGAAADATPPVGATGAPVVAAAPQQGPDVAAYTPAPAGSCQEHAGLPDPTCTPGAVDPRVTQDDVGSTICTRGYSRGVRPAESVTEPIKRERMAAYGIHAPLSQYELDHLVPLELGGASTVQNLWPEPWGGDGAHVKDDLENALHDRVCAGTLDLATAQRAIAGDWEAAYRNYVGPLPG